MQRVTDQIQELLRKQAELEADLKIARSTSENLQDEQNWNKTLQKGKRPTGKYGPTWTKTRQKKMPGDTGNSTMH